MKHFCLRALLLILLSVTVFSIANASEVEVVQVNVLSTRTLIFNLNSGQRFSGSLAISGGAGNDIDFWVTDSVGATILNLGRVSQGNSFEFTANEDGAYTLHFGNTFSLFTAKTVNLTYDIKAPLIFGLDPYVFIVIILVAIILVGALVAVAYRQGRKATQKKERGSNSESTN
jgi:hypothetical protein